MPVSKSSLTELDLGLRGDDARGGSILLGHLLDVEVVLGVGDFDFFLDEALVDLAVEAVEYATAQYRLVDPAQQFEIEA